MLENRSNFDMIKIFLVSLRVERNRISKVNIECKCGQKNELDVVWIFTKN